MDKKIIIRKQWQIRRFGRFPVQPLWKLEYVGFELPLNYQGQGAKEIRRTAKKLAKEHGASIEEKHDRLAEYGAQQ